MKSNKLFKDWYIKNIDVKNNNDNNDNNEHKSRGLKQNYNFFECIYIYICNIKYFL